MELKTGYKQTEVGVIPSDWEVKKLSELTSLITNGFVGTVKTQYTDSDDGVTYIQGYNVEENSFNFRGIKKVTKAFHNLHLKSCLQEGDLLTVQTGDVGLTTIVPKKLVGANCHALIISRFNKAISNPKYFSFYLNSVEGRARLKEIEIGTTMKHINIGDMIHFLVPVPSKIEQTVIASILSDADALITQLEKLIDKKRNIKQGAMQELLRPKDGWEMKKLGDVATIVRGASPRPIDDPKWFDGNSLIGWVRISDVTKSVRTLTETTQKLSELGINNSRYVESGNLIMSICATVGRPILTRINVCIHDGFVVFRNPDIDKEYLYYLLSFIEKEWSKNGQTGSQMNLNTTLINTTEIPIPESKTEQTRIAQILTDMDAEIEQLEKKLEKYKMMKQGMMQNLLTGKIRLV